MSEGKPGDRSRGQFGWLYGEEHEAPVEQTRVLPRVEDPTGTPPPPSQPSVPRPPLPRVKTSGRRIRPKRILAIVLALVVAYIAFLVITPVAAWKSVSHVDATPQAERPAAQPGTTYLLVGSDSRAGLSKEQRKELSTGGDVGQRTDTIMLLHTGSGPNLLMSIPRDSQVKVPGHGTTKINAAFAYGGAPLLVQTIEQATGIRIDHYVEIGFGGFVDMVDAVGGITICPEKDMKDKDAGLNVKAGCQSADGKLALAYSRSRHAQQLGDIDRARHQREVVSAVAGKTVRASTILNPLRYRSVVDAGAKSVQVDDDMGAFTFARFANALRKTTGSDGMTCGVPISDMAVHWDKKRAEALFQLIATDRTTDVGKDLCLPTGIKE